MTTTSKGRGNPLARFRLDGRVACITGGAGGIGAATAELMAAGATVVILDRDREAARATAAAIGGSCEARALDVASEPAIVDTFADVTDRHGRIDIRVANAGNNIRRTAMECRVEEWNAVVQVNLTGVFLTDRTAARHMPERGGPWSAPLRS